MPQVFDGDSDPGQIELAVRAQIASVETVVVPFRLRNRYRNGAGTWIVSIAAPAGHIYDREALTSAAAALGVLIEGDFEYAGDFRVALDNGLGEPPFEGGLPTTNEDQDCAFCDDGSPAWVHPFDPAKTKFGSGFERFMLPTFWTVCEKCEALIDRRRDSELVSLYANSQGHSIETATQVLHTATQVLHAFRSADLGARSIAPAGGR